MTLGCTGGGSRVQPGEPASAPGRSGIASEFPLAQRRILIEGAAWVEPGITDDVTGLLPRRRARPSIAGPAAASWCARGCKRAIDIVVSAIALVVLVPFTMIATLAIVVDSPGWPFFVHDRIGRLGIPFGVLKLRTMVHRAEERLDSYLATRQDLYEQWQTGFKLVDDPRLTKVGALLRRWSLDEIPQFANVLIGQMSLVGPRPVTSDEAWFFGPELPLVLSVRPGLTGLWAVSGRSELSFSQRAALEARYVRDWSLRGDLSILIRTIPAVLGRRGAY